MEEEELKANDLLDAILETNEKIQIPQFDEAEIPQSIQSMELDRSNEGSSIPVQNLVEENPPVTCASTIGGDESNEGKASSLEGGLLESEGNDRSHEFHEVMEDSVEEKESNFDGSHQLQQLAEKDDNFLSFEEALVEKGETVSPLEEGLGEKGGEVKAQCDEVMQESVDEKLTDLGGTHQNEHLKEDVLPSNFQEEKSSSFEEALDEKDEKAPSLEEGLGGKGVETHVLGEVIDEKVSLLQEELAGKEKKASKLKEENSGKEEIPILEPSVSTVDEQAVEEKEMLNGERPQLAEGDEKSYPLQEALVEKDEKIPPFKEGFVVKEEAKDRVLDEAIQENVEQKPSEFDEEIAEKHKRALSFQGESVEMDKEDSDEKEEAEEMDIDEGGPAMAAGRRTVMKRKSGRPRVSQGRRVRVRSKPKEDESLCFICFDGGDLVVCDHRSCPKVYHPSCINRDEEYFKAKGQWICGWHICSNCQKSAHYMCYTCTYSLCKGCIKGAEFVCVRGNKGFCQDCMKTVMLMETNKHADETTDMVDFDDKTSWLSLFKDYWLELNAKLSLTIEELMRARNPLKEANVASSDEETSNKMRVHQCEEKPLENSGNAYDDQGGSLSSHSTRHKESTSAMKKLKKRSRDASNKESKEAKVERSSISGDIEWASKDLLKFVAHMKNGDKSVLSHFDVQALLLQYIKQNNLRDPSRKSQIICDSRLMALFGKSRVGHLEMLKLLEPHFLIKEVSLLATDDNQGGVVDPDPSQIDSEGNSAATTKIPIDTRRRSRRRIEGGLTSLDEYAAIDVHNVSLLYLRRNLMENLLDDIDMFNENVVGAFVRIRISSAASNNDIYRLVQVVGTGKAAGTYKTGKKATDITLEILNLNKREIITVDLISNQDFTEEECERLRQSVKCGFIDRLTVAQVQEKTRGLHAVRANDRLESEKLRLGHLRDRASEKGRKKELRECVEKLQLLNTPEEHIRRLNEVPEIHIDPKMDPGYESTDDEEVLNSEGQDKNNMLKYSFRDRDEFSARRVGSGTWKNPDVACDSNKSAPKAGVQDVALPTVPSGRTDGPFRAQGNDACEESSPKTPKAIVNATGSDNGIQKNSQPVIEPAQLSGIQPQIAPQPLSTNAVSANNPSETDKLWHYQDPAGKIQGPFSMTQLRKWSSSGFFPTNLRIWRISEKQEDSILLTDAVSGKFHKDLQKQEPQHIDTSQPTKVTAMVARGADNLRGGMRGNNISQPPQPSLSSPTNIGGISPMDGRHGTSSTGCESSKNSSAWPGQSQVYDCPRQGNPFSRNSPQQPSFQGRDGRGDNNGRWNRSHGRQNSWNSNRPRRFQPNGRGYERQHPYRSSSGQQFAGEQPKVQQPANLPAHAPHPGSIDWASLQGALNRIIPSPSPCNLTSSTINSVGGCASNALPSGNPAATQENIGVLNNFQQQNKSSESTTPVTCVNHAVYSGSGAMQIVDGSNSKQSLKGNNSITTVNGDQASAGVINSESMQPANPQMNEVGDPTVSLNKPDPTKTFTEVYDTSASENKCLSVNGTELGSSAVAVAVALNPVGSSNLSDASASTSKAQSESQCFGPISSQKQGTNNPSVNPAQPSNMAYPTIPGSANMGWGMVAHGPMDVNWGALANTNMSWGPAAQAIMNPNLGWAIPTQGMPMQANSALHAGWVAPVMGNANPNPSWVAPPTQGNANQIATWGTMMPGTGQGSMNNASNQNAGDGGSLHNPPPGEQRVGVCKFHENGHCKKGASCNYIHL